LLRNIFSLELPGFGVDARNFIMDVCGPSRVFDANKKLFVVALLVGGWNMPGFRADIPGRGAGVVFCPMRALKDPAMPPTVG
jgi:hypothetical protein